MVVYHEIEGPMVNAFLDIDSSKSIFSPLNTFDELGSAIIQDLLTRFQAVK
jgi:hypothetical protein